MSDLISRQSAIDAIMGEPTDAHYPSWYSERLEHLPSEQPEQRWIPCSERLPKSSGVYIVSRWFSDGEESEILTDASYYDGCGYWYDDNRINWGRALVTDKIVAWMPLPETYKEINYEE